MCWNRANHKSCRRGKISISIWIINMRLLFVSIRITEGIYYLIISLFLLCFHICGPAWATNCFWTSIGETTARLNAFKIDSRSDRNRSEAKNPFCQIDFILILRDRQMQTGIFTTSYLAFGAFSLAPPCHLSLLHGPQCVVYVYCTI